TGSAGESKSARKRRKRKAKHVRTDQCKKKAQGQRCVRRREERAKIAVRKKDWDAPPKVHGPQFAAQPTPVSVSINDVDAAVEYKVTKGAYTVRRLDSLSPLPWEREELDELVPPPTEGDERSPEQYWDAAMARIADLFESERVAAEGTFTAKQTTHRRGDFTAVATGVSYGGGQMRPGNLRQARKGHEGLLSNLTQNPDVQCIANYQSDVLASYFPKVYAHVYDSMATLSRLQPELRRNFQGSIYPTTTFNLGPDTVCKDHNDCNNAPDVPCSITALGNFDPDKGGELYFFDLVLIVRFPPGTTILLSSASIRHGNLPTCEVFGGGRLLKVKRKPNSYNAYLHARSKENKENGIESSGKKTLPDLSSQAAHGDSWKEMSAEKKQELVDQLVAEKEEKKVIPRVRGVHASHDVSRTVATIDAEMQGLSKRTGAQYAMFTVHDDTGDTWDAAVHATDKLKSGIQDLYKVTPEQMTSKLQAYSMSGMGGVLKGSGGKKRHWYRTEARVLITQGLEKILLARGVSSDKLPRMEYSNHETLVCEYGVELAGWPEPTGIRSPANVVHTGDMERIYIAVKSGACAWRALTPEELGARQAIREQEVLAAGGSARKSNVPKTNGAAGKGKGKAKAPARKGRKGPKSAEFVPSDADESHSEDEDGGE
ncbi:hypothetical protein EWM64_g10150, partial [Hericium alpestre]